MGRSYERIGAATGAFFVIAIVVGGQMEMSGSTAATDGPGILANLQRDPTIVNRIGFTWALLGFAAFLVFVGYSHRVLRRAEGPDGWLATVPLGAGLLYLAIKVGSAAPIIAAVYRRDQLTPEFARTLVDLNDAAFVVSGWAFGLFAAAAAVICLAHRVLPRWLGWFGLVSGLLTLAAGIAGIVDPGSYNPLPFVAGLLWTLIASILLTTRRTAPAYDESAGGPARAGAAAGA
jgi:hypothetical protein